MSTPLFKSVVRSQFEAALAMMETCLSACPDEHWDGLIAKYPFWMVAYHALCFVDVYVARTNRAWKPDKGVRGGAASLHPKGRQELEDEYPSRRFERDELLRYVGLCRDRVAAALDAENAASLAGPSGFTWIKGPRAELYLYNLRHAAHHVGQLSAFLRRVNVETTWVKMGAGDRR